MNVAMYVALNFEEEALIKLFVDIGYPNFFFWKLKNLLGIYNNLPTCNYDWCLGYYIIS